MSPRSRGSRGRESDGWSRTSSHVSEEIGYASAPSGFVIDTRKSMSSFNGIPAAAELTVFRDGATKLPAAFLMLAAGSPFEMA